MSCKLNPRFCATSSISSFFPNKIGSHNSSAFKRTTAPKIRGSLPSGKTIFNPFSIFFNEQNIEFYSNILNIRQKNVNLLDIKIKKGLENNLRIRE